MKVIYNQETDTLPMILAEASVGGKRQTPGVILDYDASGNLISVHSLKNLVKM